MSTHAETQIAKVTQTVGNKLGLVLDWAEKAYSAATEAIDGIGTFDTPQVSLTTPSSPELLDPADPNLTPIPSKNITNDPHAVVFAETGQVELHTPPDVPQPNYGTPHTPAAAPSIQIPPNPGAYPTAPMPQLPGRPKFKPPIKPDVKPPPKPPLVPIAIPQFAWQTIPPFAGTIPLYTEPKAVPPVRPVFVSYSPAALMTRVNAMMQGWTPAIDVLLKPKMDELVANVDHDIMKAREDVFIGAAAQNWSITPGHAVGALVDLEVEGGRKIRQGMSGINNELAKMGMENYTAAIRYGLALEKNLIDIHVEHCRQLLECEKLRLAGLVKLFDATASMFNMQQKARADFAGTYKAEVAAVEKQVGYYKYAVDGAIAETAENEPKTRMYTDEVKTLAAEAGIYKNEVRLSTADTSTYVDYVTGIKAQADTNLANIESWRSAIQGYSAALGATSDELNAFADEVQAAASGIGVDEANAHAYAAYVENAVKGVSVYRGFYGAQGDVLQANIRTFNTAADANQSYVRAQSQRISAAAELAVASSTAYSQGTGAIMSYNKAEAQRQGAMLQFALLAAENASRADSLAAIAQAETDKVNAGALAAKAQASAGLAQGAMSVMHVSASAQGTGSNSSSAKFEMGADSVWGGSTHHNEVLSQNISA